MPEHLDTALPSPPLRGTSPRGGGSKRRLVVGISGASGAELGLRLLEILRAQPGLETHLVLTPGAEETLRRETVHTADEVRALADVCYDARDLGAAIASGTFRTAGMIVAPCSMKTLAGIVTGYSENLLLRAADVTLKEARPLVLLPRETPLSRIHLRNLLAASEAGCTIVPPMLSFYAGADTLEKQIDHVLGKALRFVGVEFEGFREWQG
ncbi:UbiX family flavin prenyltransferase [uncultured Selenomonas sp.]|uniref:UbiX family flavin prenyltransferase n=1 Tax=uncultured Selenomonas sp. TaxID=159275 RepID=UPI0025DBDFBE|nr:UbiX family flavin prenyltransferase [uncultured Selenomonas sp.]